MSQLFLRFRKGFLHMNFAPAFFLRSVKVVYHSIKMLGQSAMSFKSVSNIGVMPHVVSLSWLSNMQVLAYRRFYRKRLP